MEHGHSHEAIRQRLSVTPPTNYLRDWIYGGIDGAVTTFAIVSGVVGAQLESTVIVILGCANLLADGFSMAAGNFTGTRAEREELRRLEAVERRHITEEPEGEREEVREIYRKKGFEGELLESVVDVLTSDNDRWVRTMLTEEYGLPLSVRSPALAALSTFSAFFVCGGIPLLPFLLDRGGFVASSVLTGAVFFAIGAGKSRWSTSSWWASGAETLLTGGFAAALAYGVGHLLHGLVN